MDIPLELLEQFERGNVLLFVGERITRAPDGQAWIDRLTEDLAARCPDPTQFSPAAFPEVAQAYEDAHGRQALVQFLREQFDAPTTCDPSAPKLIAGLTTCEVLATTCIDRQLETAFAAAHRPLNVVTGNVDVAFADARQATLYKLRGALAQPESLVLTEDDYEAFFDDQAGLSLVLQAHLATKTVLFVGYDLDDPHFKRLYRKVTAPLDNYARRAYAFGDAPPPQVCRWCERHGIHVIPAAATTFLETLVAQLAARKRPAPVAPPPQAEPLPPTLPTHPYKQLDYYEAQDAAIFFGRQAEIRQITSLIHAHRLTLLYGASGTGKTSLLLAGAAPRLEMGEYTTLYVRALDDPAQVIRSAVERKLRASEPARERASESVDRRISEQVNHPTIQPPTTHNPQPTTLIDFLHAATQTLGPLVIILDQFEEFFIRLSPEFRQAFIAELGALYDARDVPVKVVLSLREDWLAAISEIEARIPEVFRTRLRLLPLTRAQAQEAITAPVMPLGVTYKPALVDRLLDDLTGEAAIMPPQLQLVCSALYDGLPAGQPQITLAAYEALGGARGVLQAYLDAELARLPAAEQRLARDLLEELVTSERTKAVKTGAELALALGVTATALAPVLEKLVRARMLRVLERETAGCAYELAHEYLIAEIVLSPETVARKEAEELLRQGVTNYERFGALLSQEAFTLIDTHRNLLHPDPVARNLLLRSALRAGQRCDYWLNTMFHSDFSMKQVAIDSVVDGLLNPKQSQLTMTVLHISQESLDDTVQKQLAQGLGSRYLSAKPPEQACLLEPLWEFRQYLPISLKMETTFKKAVKQVASHIRELVIAFVVLILTSLLVGGYFLYQERRGGIWNQYDFVERGGVSHIAIEPENPQVLWALVEGGRYGRSLHRSSDGGDTWNLVLEETTHEMVSTMIVGLGEDDQPLVYMAAYGSGIYVFDLGKGEIELRNDGLYSYNIASLIIDPEDNKTIYLGSGDKRGIYKSIDFGRSWQQIGGDVLRNESVVSIAAFDAPKRIYVLTDEDRIWFGDGISSAWELSAPEGCNPIYPERVNCDLRFTLYGKGHITNLVADRHSRLLYTATSARLIGILDDATQRWTIRFIPGAESYEAIGRIAVTGGDQALLYVNVWKSGGASLYRSKDLGETWELIIAPELPHSGIGYLIADTTSSDRLYVTTAHGGVRTIDGGENWSPLALDFPPSAVTLAYMADTVESPLYMTVQDAVYRTQAVNVRSSDWEKADYGLEAVSVRDLLADPRKSDVVYAGVYNPRQWSVFVTWNQGQHWELLGLPPAEFRDDDATSLAITVLSDQEAVFYVGTNGSGILRTELGMDFGKNGVEWTHWPGASNIHEILVPSWDPLIAYALADGRGLFKTSNAGVDWERIGEIPGTAPISGFKAGAIPDTLYVATKGDGLLCTMDGGENWKSIGEELLDSNIVALAVDVSRNDVLYVVTEAGMVYRSTTTGQDWEDFRENLDIMGPHQLIIPKCGFPKLILTGDSGMYFYVRNKFLGVETP